MKRKKRIAAVAAAVAAVFCVGSLAGCDLITTDPVKDMAQVIAEVNITGNENFKKDFGGRYDDVISATTVTKRELYNTYMGMSSSLQQGGITSDAQIYETLTTSLVNTRLYRQYAMVYFFENGWADEDGTNYTYTVQGYRAAVDAAEGEVEKQIAGIAYFLTDEEKGMADYNLRRSFNNTLDSAEEAVIVAEEDDTEYETNVRTLPTGVDSENADYFDPAYRVYIGSNAAADCGSYETQEGSTPTTRSAAYANFISYLSRQNMLERGEDTSKVEELNYFLLQKKTAYESALTTKLNETYTGAATENLTQSYVEGSFQTTLNNQKNGYRDIAAYESDLGEVSDSRFVLTTPSASDRNYGFVINILLPFSAAQTQALNDADQDFGDGKGNKFATRAGLLERVKATDQRGSWFTGATDYSFEAEAGEAYQDRKWLFFENSLDGDSTRYEPLKNYYGKYAYNGTYDADKRDYVPNEIDIDGFLAEMEGYLRYALGANALETPVQKNNYYNPQSYYNADGTVNYETFVYRTGKIDWNAVDGMGFDVNDIFVAGSKENTAMSVMNELSFAYNTDTAGLNDYLGYAISANKTNFVNEFEYASQWAVRGGAGSYAVVPSDYGWHIIYCTFSFADTPQDADTPYRFDWSAREEEGTFSYLYYEALKADAYNNYATAQRTRIVNGYSKDSSTVYADRYADLIDNTTDTQS